MDEYWELELELGFFFCFIPVVGIWITRMQAKDEADIMLESWVYKHFGKGWDS